MLGYDNDTRVDLVVVIEKYRQLKAEKHDIHNFVYHYWLEPADAEACTVLSTVFLLCL